MDAEKALKSEIFRPVVITIVPGLIALSPYLFVAAYFHPDVIRQIKGNELLAVAIILTIAIAVGHVLEDIGSRIELVLWKTFKKPDDDKKWYAYLKSVPPEEQVACSYIKDVVLRMKFENSFIAALISVFAGITWLYKLNVIASPSSYWSSIVGIVLTIAYLLYESRSGGCLLRDLRAKLIVRGRARG